MAEIAKIDYTLGQDNVQVLGLDIHNPVFVVSSLTVIAFVAGVLAFQAEAAVAFEALRAWLLSTFDWVFMGVGNFFVLFCLLLVATPLGRVRLGGADARPDYSRSAWFAMLFAAGIGIGLMFFGVSEPVEHFLRPPLGLETADTAAARLGMAGAIYHWGIHGWAIYAVVALSIAFASYNLGLPLTLRSALYPLMGKAVWGRFGHGVDILAVFATLFGLATSLGLGAQQVAAGLAHLWGTPATDTTHVLLIIGITGMALASVVSGMEKGIKRLSEVNVLLALLLLAFVLTVGPTRDIATGTVTSLGQYLSALGPLSNWVSREDLDFMHGWTTFFWAWWIAWAPFVGLFIARVSRGRTVRELIACMLIMPTLVAALWMNAFGGDSGVAVRRWWPSRRDRGGAGATAGDSPCSRCWTRCRLRPSCRSSASCSSWCSSSPPPTPDRWSSTPSPRAASWTRRCPSACSGASSRGWSPSRCCSAAASWPRRRPPSPSASPSRWCWSPCATAPGRGCARARRARSVNPPQQPQRSRGK